MELPYVFVPSMIALPVIHTLAYLQSGSDQLAKVHV